MPKSDYTKIMLNLDPGLLARIERFGQKMYKTSRSEAIRSLVVHSLADWEDEEADLPELCVLKSAESGR